MFSCLERYNIDKVEQRLEEAINDIFEGTKEKVSDFGLFYFYEKDERRYVGDRLPPAYLEGYFVAYSKEHFDGFLQKVKGKNISFWAFDIKYTFFIKKLEVEKGKIFFKIEEVEEEVKGDYISKKKKEVEQTIAELYTMVCYEEGCNYSKEEFIKKYLL